MSAARGGQSPRPAAGSAPSRGGSRGRALTLEEADAGSAGLSAQRAEGQQQRAVALGQLQVGAALVQQHHGVDLPLAQPGAELLVGDDVLQGQHALSAATDDGAEAHVAGAADVRGVEGEEGAAVEDEALRGALLQQPPQRLALQRAHPQVHHGPAARLRSTRIAGKQRAAARRTARLKSHSARLRAPEPALYSGAPRGRRFLNGAGSRDPRSRRHLGGAPNRARPARPHDVICRRATGARRRALRGAGARCCV